GWGASWIGLPVAWLVGPMLASVLLSLRGLPPGPHPPLVFAGVQAVIGVTLSASFTIDALAPIADHWLAISLSTGAVLAVSLLAGVVLARVTTLDAPTAALGTVPGGASGMVAMSEELGADARLVAFMQYARLVIVVLTISVLANQIESGEPPVVESLTETPGSSMAVRYGLAVAVAVLGGWLGVRLRIPAGALIGALLVGLIPALLSIGPVAWPPFVLPLAYLLLGARVGARFDAATMRRIGALLPPVLGFIVALSLLCAGLGWLLHIASGIDLLSALLATSPGGIDAATIAALDTGANVPLVLAVQLARLLVMVLAGPFLVRRLLRRGASGRRHVAPPR
ncbi:MAG: AbrB family transcriptional regulator, partial [Chloroflexia bacterium]|nr:AbrB family transcriptional regulator [Chloroflexia bacterium]